MSEIVIIHCDKCNSPEVIHEPVLAPPTEVHKTMSEVKQHGRYSNTSHSVYYFTTYRMVCKECGHIEKYQQ